MTEPKPTPTAPTRELPAARPKDQPKSPGPLEMSLNIQADANAPTHQLFGVAMKLAIVLTAVITFWVALCLLGTAAVKLIVATYGALATLCANSLKHSIRGVRSSPRHGMRRVSIT